MTVLSAGDLGVEVDYGIGNPPGTLQRLENGAWENYRLDGEVITSESLNIESLPPEVSCGADKLSCLHRKGPPD